jgi:phosphatidylglycerophosphate synthase
MTVSTPFVPAHRVQESFLAPAERVCLLWLARHTPRAVNSDHLTVLGLLATLLAGLSYALAAERPAALHLASFWLAVNWLGDSLDGTLARYRRCQRPRYGFYVDHMVDSFGALFLLGGLALSGYMSPLVAGAMLVAFLLLAVDSYLATYTLGTFRISLWKFSPTEMRILLAAGNAYAFSHPLTTLFGRQYLFFDVAGVIGCAGMAVVLICSVARNTAALYRAETLPSGDGR